MSVPRKTLAEPQTCDLSQGLLIVTFLYVQQTFESFNIHLKLSNVQFDLSNIWGHVLFIFTVNCKNIIHRNISQALIAYCCFIATFVLFLLQVEMPIRIIH